MHTWAQWPALITWLTLILLCAVLASVSRARRRYKIPAPATTGNEHFERVFRVQMNTLENTVAFLPALWLGAWYWSPSLAALCGAVWLAGRIWYAYAYATNPARRGAGFKLAMAAFSVLLVSSAIGWARSSAWM